MKFVVQATVVFNFDLKIQAKNKKDAWEIARTAIYERGYAPICPSIINVDAMDEVIDWGNEQHGEIEIVDLEVLK